MNVIGFEKYQKLYFNFKDLKPDILAQAEALQKLEMAATYEDSDSIENSTSCRVQVQNMIGFFNNWSVLFLAAWKIQIKKKGSKRTMEEMMAVNVYYDLKFLVLIFVNVGWWCW